ncbi:MAG TPA: SOS response-associated peptidase [Kiritimatiellae bacterium]|nr:SOS response-associated peptidase [Kiritimatiellia bacterium]
MCGRFSLTVRREEIETALPAIGVPDAAGGRYNIAPTQLSPVVRLGEDDKTRVILARWGLVPRWARDVSIGLRLINARCETIERRPAFRDAFRQRRCLVLADGFYEWCGVPGSRGRRPVYFRLKGGGLFAFAGLWDVWRRQSDEEMVTFTIVTCPANRTVGQVHDRMPVILEKGSVWEKWLRARNAGILRALLRPLDDGKMEGWGVDPVVNDPRVDDGRCIRPVGGLSFLAQDDGRMI